MLALNSVNEFRYLAIHFWKLRQEFFCKYWREPIFRRSVLQRVAWQLRVRDPLPVRSLEHFNLLTIGTVFQSQVVERIGTIRLDTLILPFNLIDVDGKNVIATVDALENFVAHPWPPVSLTSDQDTGRRRILQGVID